MQENNNDIDSHPDPPKIIASSNNRTAPLTTDFSKKVEAQASLTVETRTEENENQDEAEDDAMTSSTHTVMSVHSLQEVIESLDHLASQGEYRARRHNT